MFNEREAPDLTFVDIDMPQLSGIELAGLINRYTTVIFTTVYPDFSINAYEKQDFDYLLKPIAYERFLKCISSLKICAAALTKIVLPLTTSIFTLSAMLRETLPILIAVALPILKQHGIM